MSCEEMGETKFYFRWKMIFSETKQEPTQQIPTQIFFYSFVCFLFLFFKFIYIHKLSMKNIPYISTSNSTRNIYIYNPKLSHIRNVISESIKPKWVFSLKLSFNPTLGNTGTQRGINSTSMLRLKGKVLFRFAILISEKRRI